MLLCSHMMVMFVWNQAVVWIFCLLFLHLAACELCWEPHLPKQLAGVKVNISSWDDQEHFRLVVTTWKFAFISVLLKAVIVFQAVGNCSFFIVFNVLPSFNCYDHETMNQNMTVC